MKNKILKSLLGISAFALALNVNAATLDSVEEGSNASSYDVTVGSVDVPVYSVDILWGEMEFDWIYNASTQKYEWKNAKGEYCGKAFREGINGGNWGEFEYFHNHYYTEAEFNNLKENGKIFSDDTCQTSVTDIEYTDLFGLYYTLEEGYSKSGIYIYDSSKFGSIVPSVSWNSGTDYDWTLGEIKYRYTSSSCEEITSEEEFVSLQSSGGVYLSSACDRQLVDPNVSYDDGNAYYKRVWTNVSMVADNGSELPDDSRLYAGDTCAGDACEPSPVYGYSLALNLKTDETKTITTPKAGDKIGSVTISIRAKR